MPAYQIDIVAPRAKQTFITENLEAEEVIKTRLKSFVDITSTLTDFTIHIRPLTVESQSAKGQRQISEVECLYEQGRICPLADAQSIDTCLHCEERGNVQ